MNRKLTGGMFRTGVLLLALVSAGQPMSAAVVNGIGSPAVTTIVGDGGDSPFNDNECTGDFVMVGLGLSPAAKAGAGATALEFYCRGLAADGRIATDASTLENTSRKNVKGSAKDTVFCPAGTAAVGLRVVAATEVEGVGLICDEPPAASSARRNTALLGNGSPMELLCPGGHLLVGLRFRTGSAIGALAGLCRGTTPAQVQPSPQTTGTGAPSPVPMPSVDTSTSAPSFETATPSPTATPTASPSAPATPSKTVTPKPTKRAARPKVTLTPAAQPTPSRQPTPATPAPSVSKASQARTVPPLKLTVSSATAPGAKGNHRASIHISGLKSGQSVRVTLVDSSGK